jgi:uncharacterized protein YdeI (YjbR/CyaY-like superfamily)
MGQRNPRVDDYIAKAQPFAQPILRHLRDVVHAACPEVEEQIKWRMPSFEWKGMLAGMAAFKQHAVFGFWKHDVIVGNDPKAKEAMGSFGCLKSVKDLPPKPLLAKYVKTAMQLNEAGVKVTRAKTRPKKAVAIHPEFAAALKKNAKARTTLDGFPPSARSEYLEWIAGAKQDATRARRIATAVEWLAEGKRRNWKYESC